METIRIKLADLVQNKGQIPGLPGNPRQWTKEDVDRIAKSLRETPELFDLRPCLVFPYGGLNIILGGNLRYEGARRNKDKDVPCAVIPADTPVEKLKEIVIKDNGSFGQWDYDALANEWDEPLADWGVPAWDPEPLFSPASSAAPSAPGGQPAPQGVEGILPPELAGRDLTPDELPRIEGSDETALDRIIIVYPKDRAADVAQLLGMEKIEKVVYNANEIPLLQQ